MVKRIIIITYVVLLLTSCSVNQSSDDRLMPKENDIQQTTKPLDTNNTLNEQDENNYINKPTITNLDLSEYFNGVNGCAVIYDTSKNEYLLYNDEQVNKRSSPYSTFKIASTVIGLKNNVLESENTTFNWNGNHYAIETWNQDLSLKQAFQSSCIWYFRKVIDEVGSDIVQNTLSELSYGNCDISKWTGNDINGSLQELNGFWLDSSLLISPMEQVNVLNNIFNNFDKNIIHILKEVMLVENEAETAKIYGKTGTGNNIAWFVGFTEKNDVTCYFAIRLNEENSVVTGKLAEEISITIICDYLK